MPQRATRPTSSGPMADAVRLPEWPKGNEKAFLRALTRLSRKYLIGIAGDPPLYAMDGGAYGDLERTYSIDEQGNLTFL